jgi:hypothetical protein
MRFDGGVAVNSLGVSSLTRLTVPGLGAGDVVSPTKTTTTPKKTLA